MEIQSLRCILPFCYSAKVEQTRSSCIIRTSIFVLGAIALLVGIFILNGMPDLHSFSTGAGWLWIALGSSLLVGSCIRNVKSSSNQSSFGSRTSFIFDSRENCFSSGSDYDEGKDEPITSSVFYTSSQAFLAAERTNVIILNRLKEELKTYDLTGRLIENFGTHDVTIKIPLKSTDGVRDDAYLLLFLKLMFLTSNEILSLNAEDIQSYDNDLRNILCLRLERRHPSTAAVIYPEGSLGKLLTLSSDAILNVPSDFYLFLDEKQVRYFLNHTDKIDIEIGQKLFQYHGDLAFISARTKRLLLNLPEILVNKVLLCLSPALILILIEAKGSKLDYSGLTEEQVEDLFPALMCAESESQKKMEKVPLDIINQLLPKMRASQLQLLPKKHLSSSNLDLRSLPAEKVKGMFPTSFSEEPNSKARLRMLSKSNQTHVTSIVRFSSH